MIAHNGPPQSPPQGDPEPEQSDEAAAGVESGPVASPRTGSARRFAIHGRLAAGGMASVHFGRIELESGEVRAVALKRLHPQFCKDPDFVGMFIDEARLAARIKHPNVVDTLDVLTDRDEIVLVMEYIRGECFSKLLRAGRKRGLAPSHAVVSSVVSGMLRGLHCAHEARGEQGQLLGVVHRDVSPQNIMVGLDGVSRVLDFGVAKASARVQVTRDGQMKGKLRYMSPEQLKGRDVDRRADIFAAGAVLWESLTHMRLFGGDDAGAVLQQILNSEATAPSTLVEGLSPALDAVVLKALSKAPADRYGTALEVAEQLEQALPPASAQEVAGWVYSVAGEILSKRDAVLGEIRKLGSEKLTALGATASSGHECLQRIQAWVESQAAAAPDGQAAHWSETTPEPAAVGAAAAASSSSVSSVRSAEASGPVAVPVGASTRPERAAPPLQATTGVVGEAAPAPAVLHARRGPYWADSRGQGGASSRGLGLPLVLVSGIVLAAAALFWRTGPQPAENVMQQEKALRPGSSAPPILRLYPPSARAPAEEKERQAAFPEKQPKPLQPGALDATGNGSLRPTDASPRVENTIPSGVSAGDSVRPGRKASPASRPTRRAAASRARSAAARRERSAKVKSGAKRKDDGVDCSQPFWVDSSGIRRLKLACL